MPSNTPAVPVTGDRGFFSYFLSAPVDPRAMPINPKGYFANERTFLHWQALCLVLGALGIGLVNFSNRWGIVSGVIFTIISLGFSVYALTQYLHRSDLLSNRKKGVEYEDVNGLLLMVCCVFIGVGINFGLHFSEA